MARFSVCLQVVRRRPQNPAVIRLKMRFPAPLRWSVWAYQ
ncbi:hypothetical protein RISK_005975 [Rhodopirellula islandica]|uniref:Uncharacterized protein n=1 Tax=Rhodopirellula islandica TaxID=595434 RepID=A0A0J1B5C3_RHOIS|nr:hypothetical protein RISK_005975 [Rhodopirellula islandica]